MVVLVEGLPTDPSGASSAWAVASRLRGKHTGVSVCPDVVCYLTLHGATQHANRFQPLFGKRGGIKCHISGTVTPDYQGNLGGSQPSGITASYEEILVTSGTQEDATTEHHRSCFELSCMTG